MFKGKIKFSELIDTFKGRLDLVKENKFYIYLSDNGEIVAKYSKDNEYCTYDMEDIYQSSLKKDLEINLIRQK